MVPDPESQFIVEVDASDVGVGAVLSQRSLCDGKVHPCAFFSRRLSPAERNYDIGNKELLAIRLALGEWRHSLEAPWTLFFGQFNFTLSYRPGSKNVKPDALSRLFEAPEGELTAETILPEGMVVGALSWGIERRLEEAGRVVHVPEGCPAGRLLVPEALRPEVLQWGHESRLVCHPGIRRKLFAIRQRFWWPTLAADVRQFVLACPTCAQC